MQLTLHPALEGARACIFDAGGTLVHPDWPRLAALAADVSGRSFDAVAIERAMKEMLKEIGSEMQREATPSPDERRPHWTFRRTYRSLGLEEDVCERIIELLDATHVERHVWCRLDPEAPGVIEALKSRGLLVGVISNTEDGRLRDALEAGGLAIEFDLMLDSHLLGMRKPDAAIFRHALEILGVEPREAAYVGDSYAHDALAARAVGMYGILLDPLDLHPESVCPRVKSLGELINRAERQ